MRLQSYSDFRIGDAIGFDSHHAVLKRTGVTLEISPDLLAMLTRGESPQTVREGDVKIHFRESNGFFNFFLLTTDSGSHIALPHFLEVIALLDEQKKGVCVTEGEEGSLPSDFVATDINFLLASVQLPSGDVISIFACYHPSESDTHGTSSKRRWWIGVK